MATALDLINSALHLIGAKDPLEPATAQEAADGLVSLNDMLDSWNTDRLFVYQEAQTSVTWPASTISRTIGSGGNINVARPVKVTDSYLTDGGITYPLESISKQAYDGIPQKGIVANYPDRIFYDPGYPLGTVSMYTVPASTLTVLLNYWLQLTQFAATTDVVSLPPGYRRAIRFNLAIEIASEYGMQVPANVAAVAATSAGKLKRANAPQIASVLEVALNPARDNFSIYRGW